jgi:hypothetical protein
MYEKKRKLPITIEAIPTPFAVSAIGLALKAIPPENNIIGPTM